MSKPDPQITVTASDPMIPRLSLAMVFDLALNRAATYIECDIPDLLKTSSKSYGNACEGAQRGVIHSLEERRAVLSVYFITST